MIDSFCYPKTLRVFAILQLCLLFSLFLYLISTPFFLERFNLRRDIAELEFAMGKQNGLFMKEKHSDFKEKLQRNEKRWQELPFKTRKSLQERHEQLLQKEQGSLFLKMQKMLSNLFLERFPFRQLWLVLGFFWPLFILKDKKRAALLLIIWTAIPISEWFFFPAASLSSQTKEQSLPTEEKLMRLYADDKKLSQNIFIQREELLEALNNYFAKTYGSSSLFKEDESPSLKSERGKWLFYVKELESSAMVPKNRASPSPFFLFLETGFGLFMLCLMLSRIKIFTEEVKRACHYKGW